MIEGKQTVAAEVHGANRAATTLRASKPFALPFAFDAFLDGEPVPNGVDPAKWGQVRDRVAFGSRSGPQTLRFHRTNLVDILRSYGPVRFVRASGSSESSPEPAIYSFGLHPHGGDYAGLRAHFCERIAPAVTRHVLPSGGLLLLDWSSELFGKPLLDSIVAMLRDASVPSERAVCAVCNFSLPASARATGIRFERYHFAISYGARRFGSRIRDRERFVRIHGTRKRMSTGETRSHSYLCLNGSLRPHRLMLALWLIRVGHLEKGLVSFPAVDGQSVKLCLALPSSLDCRHPRGQDLVRMLGRLTPRLPLHVDRPLPLDRMSSLPRVALNAYEDFTAWPYEQTYFSIVTESEFCTGNRARFTEKICKPIVNLHPFILVGSPGMLAELRGLGFQTFQPFIDESYDAIRDPWSRLEAVFRQIDALCRLSLRELDDWYRALLPRLLHNRRQFFVQGRREAYRMCERLTDILVEGC